MIKKIHELVSDMLGDKTIRAIANYGKDTVNFMLDKLRHDLDIRGYSLDTEEENNNIHLTSHKNGDIIRDIIVDRLKISDGEITYKDLI